MLSNICAVRCLHKCIKVVPCSTPIDFSVSCTAFLLQFHPGNNVGLGKDYTIFSLIDGLVKFEKYGPDKKKVNFRFHLVGHAISV